MGLKRATEPIATFVRVDPCLKVRAPGTAIGLPYTTDLGNSRDLKYATDNIVELIDLGSMLDH